MIGRWEWLFSYYSLGISYIGVVASVLCFLVMSYGCRRSQIRKVGLLSFLIWLKEQFYSLMD